MKTRNKPKSYRQDLGDSLKHITRFEQMVDHTEGCQKLIELNA